MRQLICIVLITFIIAGCSTKQGPVELTDQKDKRIILINYGLSDRASIAKAIQLVNKGEPKIIGINALFIELKPGSGDTLLSQALGLKRNAIIASNAKENSLLTSNILFTKNCLGAGLVSYGLEDSIVTCYKPYQIVDEKVEWSFPISVVSYFDPIVGQELMETIIPNTYYTITYQRSKDQFDIVDLQEINDGSIEKFKDKIILFGYLGGGKEDLKKTPIGDMYGTVILANMISNLLDKKINKQSE